MSFTPIIDTAISLILIFMIMSVLVSCIQEGYVSIYKSRGNMLKFSIYEILDDKFNKNFGYLLYQHPLIDLLRRKQGDLPSYIDGKTFAKAIIDMIAEESVETVYNNEGRSQDTEPRLQFKSSVQAPEQENRMANFTYAKIVTNHTGAIDPQSVDIATRFRLGVDSLRHSELKRLLMSFISAVPQRSKEVGKDQVIELEELQGVIQQWFDGYQERVTGWYKRKVRKNLLFASIVVTLFFNLNFIKLSKVIYLDSHIREALVSQATQMAGQVNAIDSIQEKFKKSSNLKDVDVNMMLGVELPMGWQLDFTDRVCTECNWWYKGTSYLQYLYYQHFKQNFVGWFIFILGLSYGSPFWFDMLKKVVNVRNAGLSPNKS